MTFYLYNSKVAKVSFVWVIYQLDFSYHSLLISFSFSSKTNNIGIVQIDVVLALLTTYERDITLELGKSLPIRQ